MSVPGMRDHRLGPGTANFTRGPAMERETAAAAVERALRGGAGALLESIWLFDHYTGSQIGEGKKSLAYALRFRASDRTLTDAEAAEARDAAVAAAAERTGAVQRTV